MRTSYPTTPLHQPEATHPSKVRPNPTQHNWTIWQPAQHVNVPGVQRNEIPRSHLTSTAVRVEWGMGGVWGLPGGRSGVGNVLVSYVQHPKWTTRSPLSHRVPEYQFREGEERVGGIQLALLQKLILHSSLSAAVCVAFPFFSPCLALSSSFAAVSIWFYCRCCSCCFCFYYLTRRISACLAFYYFWGFCAFYFATLYFPLWVIILYKMWGQWAYLV